MLTSKGEYDDIGSPIFDSTYTVTLGELIEEGCGFGDSSWDFDCYDESQRNRFYKKAVARWKYRDIGIIPYKRWKHEFLRKLNEIMPKYKPLYKALEDGMSFFQIQSDYTKGRDIRSDFPQTALGGNYDYASNGLDSERETIVEGNYLDVADKVYKTYNDVDLMVLHEMDSMFSCILTPSINVW